MESGLPQSGGSRKLVGASAFLITLVLAVAVVVGDYAVRNPNHIILGQWPVLSEVFAAAAVVVLVLAAQANRRRPNAALFAMGAATATVALLLLGLVAFVLSFNQT